eukprot:8946954-Pyramimonas_sp.AAC.1
MPSQAQASRRLYCVPQAAETGHRRTQRDLSNCRGPGESSSGPWAQNAAGARSSLRSGPRTG